MYSESLSYFQLREYLTVIIENDLLHYDPAVRKFKTTDKGIRFLEIYNKIGDVIEREEIEL
jgi:predicted transcriptional regulator